MAKKKKISPAKKITIVCGAVIVFEVVFLTFFGGGETITTRDAIDRAIRKQTDLEPRRAEQMRIQLALQDYMNKNGGNPPEYLDQLRGTYFDSVPVDPATSKPFSYKIDPKSRQPLVGYDVDEAAATAEASSQTPEVEGSGIDTAIAALEQADAAEVEKVSFVYDPTGKRDPFRPFDMTPKGAEGLTPLERYDYGQLKLTAVLGAADAATAIVENSAGKGFTVKKGTKIGSHGGVVVEILPDKLLILETLTDFTGESKTQTIELRLRTKDQNTDQ